MVLWSLCEANQLVYRLSGLKARFMGTIFGCLSNINDRAATDRYRYHLRHTLNDRHTLIVSLAKDNVSLRIAGSKHNNLSSPFTSSINLQEAPQDSNDF